MEILGEEVDMTDNEMQTTGVRTMTNDVSRLVNKKNVYFKTKLLQRLKSTVQFLYIASCCVKRKLYYDIMLFCNTRNKTLYVSHHYSISSHKVVFV